MLISSTPVTNFQLVSVIIPSSGSKYYFPDLPNLRDAFVSRINVYDFGYMRRDVNNNLLYDGTTVTMFLTLVRGNDEIYKRIPCLDLSPIWYINNPAVTTAKDIFNANGGIDFDFQQFNFSKSYIEFSDGTTPTVGQSISFGIFYKK